MTKRKSTSTDYLRDVALLAARGSFGFRRHRVADVINRAKTFEAWLKPFQQADYAGWLLAKRALTLAVEDSRFDRGQRQSRAHDTRTVLRRAEAYRAFLVAA